MDLLPVSPAKSSGNWMMTKDVLCRGHVVVDLYVFGCRSGLTSRTRRIVLQHLQMSIRNSSSDRPSLFYYFAWRSSVYLPANQIILNEVLFCLFIEFSLYYFLA
jgi:hypothetical protein